MSSFASCSDPSVFAAIGVMRIISAQMFRTTVTHKNARKVIFCDLCRNICCAMSAPGHPPNKAIRCKVFSGVLHSPF